MCEVPLNDMFGCKSLASRVPGRASFACEKGAGTDHSLLPRADASQLRGMTQGKGEFTMEYIRHSPVLPNVQKDMIEAHKAFVGKK